MFPTTLRAAICLGSLGLLPASALAQTTDEPKPFEAAPQADYDEPDRVLLPGKVKHGGFGAPKVKLTTMIGEPALLVGGQGGWIINHGFVIGAAGYGLSTTHDAPAAYAPANTRSTLQFGYGGPRLGYIFRSHDVVHLTLGVLVGGGGYTILSRNAAADDTYTHGGRGFFVLEPQAELETNVLRFLRVGFGISYRYVGTKAVPYLETADLSGPAASLVAKLGSF